MPIYRFTEKEGSRMKKITLAVIIISVALLPCVSVFAASKQSAAKVEAEKAVRNLLKKQEMQRVNDLLGSKEWVVYLVPSGVSAGKRLPVVTDVLTFKDGRVSSQHLTAMGFGSSNYTLTVQDDMSSWETMQRTEKEDLAFWRGELRGDLLTGVMNMHTAKGAVEEYSFGMSAPVQQTQSKKR
jgi:hypothetical protein